jgi:exonuclease SbcC
MSKNPKTASLGNRQAILDEISTLLKAASGIDETRAKKVRKAVDALRDTGDTPAGEDDSQLEAKIDAGLETLRARVHKQVERRNRDYDKALKLMDELETALRDNELQHAERSNRKILSLMGNIPGLSEQRWKDIDKRLQRVRPQLRKLESWRHWGTNQVRQDLINQITQLKDEGLKPEELAKRIQQARDQWHTWDKSGDHAGKELWKTFDQACEEAYRPCIAHFEKLKKRRRENLDKRRAIIDRLNARYASTDWKQPDWREIDKLVSHARRDFYKTGNVDFRHRKPVARALDEVIEQFEEHLSRERSRSLRAREKLIADIEALAELDNLRDALDQLEGLKRQWKITVVGKRDLENKLWKRFQTACDMTYKRRDTERREQAAERNNNLRHKQALIDELDGLAAAGDGELLANASALARIQGQWEEIGWVPRNHENGLNSRWRDAQKRFSDALRAAKSRAHGSELDNIARRAALCNQWEQAVLAGDAVDADAATSEWNALPVISASSAEAMQRRFTQALTRPDDDTLSSNLAEKQAACLRLEVLLELESPAEYQAERMAYQIERLNASMKKDQSAQDSPGDLLLAALTTGAVPAGAAAAIEQRIHTCLARHRQGS